MRAHEIITKPDYVNILAFTETSLCLCCSFFQGPVNHFLSWSGWIPLSKLTYCAYLCHYIFLIYDNGVTRTDGNLTTINVVSKRNQNIF